MIVLDTHVWVWAVADRSRLSKIASKALQDSIEQRKVFVSSISVWEVALLVSRGRLVLSMELDDWVAQTEQLAFLNFVPVDNQIACKSVSLPPPLHADPADRIIVATALVLNAPLLTKDDKLLAYPHLQTLW